MDVVFVNGLVKSREKYLISERAFLQAADAESFSDAVKILRENGFGVEGEVTPSDYETFVSSEWEKFFDFLKKYSPTEKFLRAVSAKYDFYNAEYALREKYVSASPDGYASEGIVKISDIKAYIGTAKGEIPDYLKSAIDEGVKEFESGNATGKSIGTLFKRAYYSYMQKTVRGKVWKEFITHEADALNLSVALRSASGKGAEKEYVFGGKISVRTLNFVADGDGEKALNDLKHTEYLELLQKGLNDKAEGKALTSFELAADDFAMNKLKERRFESEGITPLLLYTYYKINEIKNARIILAAKASGIGKDEIIRRLRSGYAG